MPAGALAVAILVAAGLIAARAPVLVLVGLPLAGACVVLFVLSAQLWLTRVAERRLAGARADAAASGRGGARRTSTGGRRWLGVPPFHFTSPAAWAMTQTKAAWEAAPDAARPSLPGAPPFLEAALDSLLRLILRDFVLKWYSTLSDSPAFPAAVDRTIRDTLVALAGRVASVDWSEVLVGRILPLLTTHLESFHIADEAVRAGPSDSDETDLFVASRFASSTKGGKLHPAIDVASINSRPAEEAWLRELAGGILPLVVPEREMESAAVRVMVREIVACAVLLPVFELLSDPDWYNRMIDDKAGAAIRDQKMVNEFREALDKQGSALAAVNFQIVSPKTPPPARKTEIVSVRTSARQFDAWLAGINAVKTLGDARRLRSDVTAQIRKAKLATDGRGLDEVVEGVKVADWVDFIERLYTAKRKIDRRIAKLGGTDYQGRAPSLMASPDSHVSPVALRDLLLEPTAVTYIMEFLERRRHASRAQFWLLVEGLKDPLEELDAEQPATTTSAAEHGASALEDICMIWDAYLSRDPFHSSSAHLHTVRSFVEREPATSVSPQEIRRVRHALFAIQGDVLLLLEDEDLPAFYRSDLYFKAVATLPTIPSHPSSVVTPPTPAAPLPPLRPYSRTNPLVPPLRKTPSPSPSSVTPLASPTFPSRPASPALLGQPLGQRPQRTDTAPPQVTFQAAFNRPATRRADLFDSDAPLRDPVRKVSGGSVETVASVLSAPTMERRKSNLADSLEFLMSPPPEVDRTPLFGAENSVDVVGDEVRGDDEDAPSDDDYVQVQTIEAIQEALSSILATDARTQPGSGKSSASLSSLQDVASGAVGARPSTEGQRRATMPTDQAAGTPPLSSTTGPASSFARTLPTREGTRSPPPLPARPRLRPVFDDGETLEDVDVGGPAEPDFDPHSIVLPAPGDLNLPAEVARLTESLAKLKSQEAVVEALIRKAELTGNASELKLLVKSRESLRREIRAASFQKDQFEAQATENELSPDRTRVAIPGTTVGQAGPGAQSFQLYLVEVHQVNPDGSFRAGWIVTRRYSEFSSLYNKLRDKYVAARCLDFPSKRLVGIWSKEFIEQRREGLERYLQSLIKLPVVCQSNELRAFLSQQTIALPKSNTARKVVYPLLPGQALRNLYRGLTSGIDDVLGTSTTSMVDTIVARLGQQAAEFAGLSGGKFSDEDLVGQLSGVPGSGSGTPGEEGLTNFTAPICDLFINIFALQERNNWLRRQAILIVLQQVLGGTIERKFRDGVKMLLAPPQLAGYISTLQNAMWPDGELRPKEPPRTSAQKAATKESAGRNLATLMPDVAANLIGRQNAKQGARRIFAVLQNRRLNKHLIYSVVDEVVAVLFPELSEQRNRPLFLS
ncbi:hypothetical protein JCM3770_002539 [Rhodotorula araucariae]